ncbi:MAG: hypothetical protein SCH39_05550 [Methanosarcinales archaeon]|nr:hypothetical protein [Methanosarcinales archaeon]
MFKGKRKDKNIKYEDDYKPLMKGDLASRCVSFMDHPHDLTYNALIRECGSIGNSFLRMNFYIPPSIGRTAYLTYEGKGSISMDRTIQEICTHGRRLDSIITRAHVKDKKRTNLAILIDNSFQMTSDWQSNKMGVVVKPEKAPHILAKIAAVSILESLGRDVDEIEIITFNDDVQGPFNHWQLTPRDILKMKGGGLSRLDLGLAKLLQLEWEARPGDRILFILGGGLPFTGTNIVLDDIELQVNVLYYLNRMLRQGVKATYIPFFTNNKLIDERVGGFSPRSLANKIRQLGVAVSEIDSESSLPTGLRNNFRDMMIGPKRSMPMFEQ